MNWGGGVQPLPPDEPCGRAWQSHWVWGRGAAVPKDGDERQGLLGQDSLVPLWLPGGRASPKLLLISYGPGPNATFLTTSHMFSKQQPDWVVRLGRSD